MNHFDFPLAPVLQRRRIVRDHLRCEIASIASQRAELLTRRTQIEAERLAQFSELRRSTADRRFDVEGSLSRRAHADRLSDDLARLDIQVVRLNSQIDARRADLVLAEQRVESLERLEERRREEFHIRRERHEILRYDEACQTAHTIQKGDCR